MFYRCKFVGKYNTLIDSDHFTLFIHVFLGLVGGTFAPSLFLGGVLGAGFHNIVSILLLTISHAFPELSAYPILQGISGLPAFAMVGAASVLAALFRALLTASLLLFECTGHWELRRHTSTYGFRGGSVAHCRCCRKVVR